MILRRNRKPRLLIQPSYNLGDFGIKTSRTIGSISASSNQLSVSSTSGFAVGDTVVVEIGGEASFNGRAAGTRGTKGVGGVWPALSYPSVTGLNADTGRVNGYRAWTEDTGQTYTYNSASSTWSLSDQGFYYDGMANPISLRARIIGISGSVLTLNRTAAVSTSGANVYFDNAYILSRYWMAWSSVMDLGSYPLFQNINTTTLDSSIMKVVIPPGEYAVGEQLYFQRPGMTVMGNGIDNTVLFSPKGCASFNIKAGNDNQVIEGFSFKCNARLQGFGSHWEQWIGDPNQLTNQTNSFKPPEGMIFQGSHNSIAENIKFYDPFWATCGSRDAQNMYRNNIQVFRNDPMMMYIQWHMQDAGNNPPDGPTGINNTWENCSFYSDWITKAFESFNSTGAKFLNCSFHNGIGALNNAANFTIKNCTQRFTANSRHSEITLLDPCINQNFNAGTGATGGLIENHQITFDDYIDSNNNLLYGISTQPTSSGITIKGGFYHAPNYSAPATNPGAVGIENTGDNIIDGFEVTGTVNTGGENRIDRANIGSAKGIVKNCVAPLIVVQAPPVTLGTGAEANTGTIVTI